MHNEKEGMPVTALREIKILKALKHPCIINIVDMIVVRGQSAFSISVITTHTIVPGKGCPVSVHMVFPYMDHDLAGLLENERVKLTPSHIKLYMRQLMEGTEYMHRVWHPYDSYFSDTYTIQESYFTSRHEGG